ncbi:MAG: hypothetical protein IKU27_08070, partial [Clostridia bacterium]|nr:hypothetical protein [Clostridia bacterium]
MKKRLLSLILAISMVLGMMPQISLTAKAADGAETTNHYLEMLKFQFAENGYGLPGEVAGGRILQAWNWSFANIEAKLETIAKQGFGAVLVSPPNEVTETTADAPATDWQKFYAPAGFQINKSTDNALGTKDEFKSMCAEADKYGIKIIVDTVVGYVGAKDGENSEDPMDHVHDRVKNFEPEIVAAKAFHHPWTECTYRENYWDGWSDYEIEQSLTYHAVEGKPDLATETQVVQDAVYDYLKELVEAGADGFSFYDVKHIETDHDTYFASDFWEDTLGMLRAVYSGKELYAHGLVLSYGVGDGREFSEYGEYMEITDIDSFWKIVSAVQNKEAEDALPVLTEDTDLLFNELHSIYAAGGTSALTVQ